MLGNLLADKPLVAAIAAFVSALAVSVLQALGLGAIGPEMTAVVDAAAGVVVTSYVAGEAHKAAAASGASVAGPATPTTAVSPAAGPVPDPSAALANALTAAADALKAG